MKILFLFLLLAPTILAQPLNITSILSKAGQFNTLTRLLKSTQIADQINSQLNNSNSGTTLFAPTDNAFSNLPPGTLNSLSDQQKVTLIQFHIIPSLITMPQFQTVSNPLRTQAGDTGKGQFPLNVTSSGNQVNVSSGVVSTSVANVVYLDGKIAVYEVDKVLLPLEMFGAKGPARAPESRGGGRGRREGEGAGAPKGASSKEGADDGSSGSSGFRFDCGESRRAVVYVVVVGSLLWLNV